PSAFVKLVVAERETGALRAALAPWARLTSSALLEVEAVIAARRRDPRAAARARELLADINLIEIGVTIRRDAGDLPDPGLRPLDAIHLATALSLGERCGAFYCYDDRLVAAAREHGLRVSFPGP